MQNLILSMLRIGLLYVRLVNVDPVGDIPPRDAVGGADRHVLLDEALNTAVHFDPSGFTPYSRMSKSSATADIAANAPTIAHKTRFTFICL